MDVADVLLIFPSDCELSAKRRNSRPPAGLMYLAAMLVKAGFRPTIIDQTVDNDWHENIVQALKKKPICVGITSMSGKMIMNGINICRFISDQSDVPIVWGGAHPTLEPESTAADELIDAVVIGEGEQTFLELVNSYAGSGEISGINGLAYKENGIIKYTTPRERYNLDSLPPLPFHLVDIEKYRGVRDLVTFFNFTNDLAFSYETSRGCTHRCQYCVQSITKMKWRGMSPEKLIDDLQYMIKTFRVRSFAFIDDNFFVDFDRAEKIMKMILAKNLRIEFFADIRCDSVCKIDIGLLKLVEKAGCRTLGIGVESGSDRILRYLHKGEKRATMIEANRKLAKTKIRPCYGFILGLPGEELEDVKQTYSLSSQMMQENPCARIALNKLIPTPNTQVFQDCVKMGYKKPANLAEWSTIIDTKWETDEGSWMDPAVKAWAVKNKYFCDLAVWVRGRPQSSWWGELILRFFTHVLNLRIRKNLNGFFAEEFIYKIAFWFYKRLLSYRWFQRAFRV